MRMNGVDFNPGCLVARHDFLTRLPSRDIAGPITPGGWRASFRCAASSVSGMCRSCAGRCGQAAARCRRLTEIDTYSKQGTLE